MRSTPPLIRLTAALGLLAGFAFAQAPAPAAKMVFKIASVSPENHVSGQAFKAITAEVAKATNGEVIFKFYLGGVQGDESAILRKMRIGQLDGAAFTTRGMSGLCPNALVMQLPLLFRTDAEADTVFAKLEPELEAECRRNGYEVLGWPRIGFNYLFSRDSVHNLAELRAAKAWLVADDQFSQTLFETANIPGVTLGLGDVLPGLRSGLVRTVFCPPVVAVAMQWHGMLRYRLDMRLGYSFGALFVPKKKWDRVSPENQAKVLAICHRQLDDLTIKLAAQNREALTVMQDNGQQTITPTPEAITELSSLTEQVSKRLVGQAFEAKAWTRTETLLRELRKP
jgi:TRAP-type transport system periplasmic protein